MEALTPARDLDRVEAGIRAQRDVVTLDPDRLAAGPSHQHEQRLARVALPERLGEGVAIGAVDGQRRDLSP
jgi:hypothetical protein